MGRVSPPRRRPTGRLYIGGNRWRGGGGFAFSGDFGRVGVQAIFSPASGILLNVFSEARERFFIPNDVIVKSGLPGEVAAAALPVSAARPCSCEFCQNVPPNVRCNLEGPTTCGEFLIVALC